MLRGSSSVACNMRRICSGDGVQVVAKVPWAGPVPPPISVVTPDGSFRILVLLQKQSDPWEPVSIPKKKTPKQTWINAQKVESREGWNEKKRETQIDVKHNPPIPKTNIEVLNISKVAKMAMDYSIRFHRGREKKYQRLWLHLRVVDIWSGYEYPLHQLWGSFLLRQSLLC